MDMKILYKKYPELIDKSDRMQEIMINDIPILFGQRGEIICIPNKKEIPSPIGIAAKKGKGKTLLLNRISGEAFWNLGYNVAIMNDSLEECYDWTKTQNNPYWIEELKIIGEIPYPTPLVYIYPNSATLNLDEVKVGKKSGMSIAGKDINYVKITLPFSELLDNIEQYVELDKSGAYLRNIKEDLYECATSEEVNYLINEMDAGKSTLAVRHKILTHFENIFREKILNITNPECPAFLSDGKYIGNPFVVLMKIGVVPCFITSELYTKRYKAQTWAYHINSIFNAQDDIFKGQKTYLIFDELTKVCSTEEDNIATDSLNQIAARGRMKGIGLVYATQNYEKIPHIIRSNTEYLLALRHSNKSEVNEIKKDFDLTRFDEEELLKLNKFECLAITSEFFRVYHPDGKIEEITGSIKGKIIPPMARHLAGGNR